MEIMQSKKLINSVEKCVEDNIEGILALHPGLCRLKGHKVLLRRDVDDFKQSGKVATLIGGGSGHEPAFAGYLGEGMLTGAIMGPIFASPGPNTILAAIKEVGLNNSAGVIISINNYTGDRLNFGIAMERAKSMGIKVGMLITKDDCALINKDKTAGRRGLAGCLFIAKVIGALAEEGKCFEEIMEFGQRAIEDVGTLGVCLSACSVPGSGPLFSVRPDYMEIGLGLHGEAGIQSIEMMSAKETIEKMVTIMFDSQNPWRINLPQGVPLAIMLNNLGSTTELEMNILAKETTNLFDSKGMLTDRMYSGRWITSQEMSGFSLTIVKLNDDWIRCLDKPTGAFAWPIRYVNRSNTKQDRPRDVCINEISEMTENFQLQGAHVSQDVAQKLGTVLENVCDVLTNAEKTLNRLDSRSGDGDCGTTMKTGAEAIRKHIHTKLPLISPYSLLLSLATVIETHMGGSSAALYSLFLTAASQAFKSSTDATSVRDALELGIGAIRKYGGAEPGDRTMVDPLCGALNVLKKDPLDMAGAVQAAENAAKDTASMKARAGRASYVNEDLLTEPDPGAVAVSLWMRAALNAWG